MRSSTTSKPIFYGKPMGAETKRDRNQYVKRKKNLLVKKCFSPWLKKKDQVFEAVKS
jgi:hypothetical protein